jgi:outer membrane protein insertion porin family
MRRPFIILSSLVLMAFGVSSGQAGLAAASTLSLQQETPNEELRTAEDADERQRKLEIEFEGNSVFSTRQLLDHANQCWDDYNQPGNEVDSKRLIDECLHRLAFFMRSQGYLRASLKATNVSVNDTVVKVSVPVNEGIRYRIGEIRIEGSRLFSPAQIMEVLDIKTGDIASGEKIGDALFDRLKKLYADKGHIQYSAEPEPTFRESSGQGQDGVVDFDIFIDEGPQFTVHTIRFAGHELAAEQELQRALLLRDGDVYSEQLFYDSIKTLNQLGLFNGDRERDVDFMWNNEKPELDIIIHLKPRGDQPLKRKAAPVGSDARSTGL